MFLQVFSDNPWLSNCWLLAVEGREEAVVVDPGFFPERVLAMLRRTGKRPVAVLATHGHYDHVAAAREVCGADIPFYIHKEDELALSDQAAWGSDLGLSVVRPQEVRTFADGEALELAGIEFEVLHTPGHTPGSSCFRGLGLIFTGDLVFRGSIGRYDFPNSSERLMMASLRRFLALPDELIVCPGHLDRSTVGEERANNPFLRQLA